jgi:putative protease
MSPAEIIVPEIVSPAGNLEKLTAAVLYGADAVYFGGENFNLRNQAENFSLEEIGRGLCICREKNVKTIFLLNTFLREEDIPEARRYLSEIKNFNFDAVMISDPGMIALVRESGIESEIHLSTQMSTLNHLAVKFWSGAGIKRIVLAREASTDDIRTIKDNTDAKIEVFVHGALCIAYSGRCLLSRFLSGRDANQGDCAQACRWRYSLVEENRAGDHLDIIEHAAGTEIMSSKDLNLIERLREYIEAGVDAFKIEGRMKSLYYAANTTRIYKHAVMNLKKDRFMEYLPFYKSELDLVSHRPYTDDLFNEFGSTGFTPLPYIKKAMFLGHNMTEAGPQRSEHIKIFNPIYRGETVEAIFPITDSIRDDRFTVTEIFDQYNERVAMARPGLIYRIKFDKELGDNAILRRRLN